MAGPLAGKVALVSGAGQNIGRKIALFLAADGARIIVNGRRDRAALDRVVAEIGAAGGEAVACVADVSKPDEVARMVDEGVAAFGGIDILVNNAGLRRQTPFLEISLGEWREILSVALEGAFIVSQAVVPVMVSRGGGAIVSLSGISHRIGTPNRAHVQASKAGLEGLMRALAVELAPHRITCNCVSPGSIDTVRGAAAGVLPATMKVEGIPAKRQGTVDEIAAMVGFLVGPQGGFITGQTIHINGGAYLS